MKKLLNLTFGCLVATISLKAQTATTTTITGSVKITDSLNVNNSIKSSAGISAGGAITAAGEVISKDTMRALKDILVDGNVIIDGNMKVAGTTSLTGLRVSGGLEINTVSPITLNPCLQILLAQPTTGSNAQVIALSSAQIGVIEANLDANPCPTPPVIPFTWNTYGNHVNSNNRWIGTIENFDFNIRTNNILRMNVKNNGTVNMFTLNANTTGALVIKNNDLNKNIFQVQPNGATYIGTQRVLSRPNSMLTVSGELDCSSLYVLKPVTWQDRVFEPNYKLESLISVENYFKANKHLPGIKSEKEILEKGYDVNEIDAVLLEKIENLYLYIIQQQKEIDALKMKLPK